MTAQGKQNSPPSAQEIAEAEVQDFLVCNATTLGKHVASAITAAVAQSKPRCLTCERPMSEDKPGLFMCWECDSVDAETVKDSTIAELRKQLAAAVAQAKEEDKNERTELLNRALLALHNQRTAYENTKFLDMCEERIREALELKEPATESNTTKEEIRFTVDDIEEAYNKAVGNCRTRP